MESGNEFWTESSNLLVRRRRSDVEAKQDDASSLDVDDVICAQFQLTSGGKTRSGENSKEPKLARKSISRASTRKSMVPMALVNDTEEKEKKEEKEEEQKPCIIGGPDQSTTTVEGLTAEGRKTGRKTITAMAEGKYDKRRSMAAGRKSLAAMDDGQAAAADSRKSIALWDGRQTIGLLKKSVARHTERKSISAAAYRRKQPLARQSISGVSVYVQDVLKVLRPKINTMLSECMQIANYRLLETAKKADAMLEIGSTATSLGVVAAWPFESLSPLLWLPSVMQRPPSSHSSDAPRAYIPKKTGGYQVYGRVEVPLRIGVQNYSSNFQKKVEQAAGQQNMDDNDPEVAQDAFHQAFSDAKLAQAQAQAAGNEVQRLQAALKKLQEREHGKQEKRPTWGAGGTRLPGNHKDKQQERAPVVLELEMKKDQMKKHEAQLNLQCRDAIEHIYVLQLELMRRDQRASLAKSPRLGSDALPHLPNLSRSQFFEELERQMKPPEEEEAKSPTPRRVQRGTISAGSTKIGGKDVRSSLPSIL